MRGSRRRGRRRQVVRSAAGAALVGVAIAHLIALVSLVAAPGPLAVATVLAPTSTPTLTPSSTGRVGPPDVRGQQIDAAIEQLRLAGWRELDDLAAAPAEVARTAYVVVDEALAPSTIRVAVFVPPQVVTLAVGVAVPTVYHRSLASAQQRLAGRGLTSSVRSIAATGTWRVSSQVPAAGSLVPFGTEVRLRLQRVTVVTAPSTTPPPSTTPSPTRTRPRSHPSAAPQTSAAPHPGRARSSPPAALVAAGAGGASVLAGGAALLAVRRIRPRPRRTLTAGLDVRLGADPGPELDLRESGPPVDFALRLTAHADNGSFALEEVSR